MGVVSEVLPVFSRKPLFGYKAFVFATIGIGLLSFTVWAHHMFTTGAVFLPFFSFMTALIAIPTGIKMFNWLGHAVRRQDHARHADAVRARLHRDVPHRRHQRRHARLAPDRLPRPGHVLRRRPPALRLLRRLGVRRLRRDVLLVPEDDRPRLNEPLGKVHFWIHFIGFNLAFFPMHQLGLSACRGASATTAPTRAGRILNIVSTVGAFMIAVSIIPFLINVIATLINGEPAGDDPWEGNTLGVGDDQPAAAVQLRPAAADPLRAAALLPDPRPRPRGRA